MKFHQLSLGQQFQYQGRHFIKTSPIIAWCDESDNQEMIPRSAEVRTSGQADAIPREQAPHIPLQHAKQVLLKWHAYSADCLQSVADNPAPGALAEARRQLEQAQKQFLRELENMSHNHFQEEQSE